jgi:hypothetical protein
MFLFTFNQVALRVFKYKLLALKGEDEKHVFLSSMHQMLLKTVYSNFNFQNLFNLVLYYIVFR